MTKYRKIIDYDKNEAHYFYNDNGIVIEVSKDIIIDELQEEIKRQEKSQVILDNQNADLKEENITLREQIRTYYRPELELNKHKYEILQERINKATEEINYMLSNADLTEISGIKLKQILQGEDNE